VDEEGCFFFLLEIAWTVFTKFSYPGSSNFRYLLYDVLGYSLSESELKA